MWQSHSKEPWGTASGADFMCMKTQLSRAIDFQVSLRLCVLHISLAGQPVRKWIFQPWYNKAQGKLSWIVHLVSFLCLLVVSASTGVNAGSVRGKGWLCGKQGWFQQRNAFFALGAGQTLYTFQVCLQSLSRDVHRSGVLTTANSILCFIVSDLAETAYLRHFGFLPVKNCAQQIKAGQTPCVGCQEDQVAESFSHVNRH